MFPVTKVSPGLTQHEAIVIQEEKNDIETLSQLLAEYQAYKDNCVHQIEFDQTTDDLNMGSRLSVN